MYGIAAASICDLILLILPLSGTLTPLIIIVPAEDKLPLNFAVVVVPTTWPKLTNLYACPELYVLGKLTPGDPTNNAVSLLLDFIAEPNSPLISSTAGSIRCIN